MMTNEEYQKHMDELALRVGHALKGMRLEDAISACAANIGFGMVQLPSDQHEKMRAHFNLIIDTIIEKTPLIMNGVEQ
jgi:hypothetical protein